LQRIGVKKLHALTIPYPTNPVNFEKALKKRQDEINKLIRQIDAAKQQKQIILDTWNELAGEKVNS